MSPSSYLLEIAYGEAGVVCSVSVDSMRGEESSEEFASKSELAKSCRDIVIFYKHKGMFKR